MGWTNGLLNYLTGAKSEEDYQNCYYISGGGWERRMKIDIKGRQGRINKMMGNFKEEERGKGYKEIVARFS